MGRRAYKCCVEDCTFKDGISHRFPNPKLYLAVLEQWVKILGQEKFSGLDPQAIYNKKRVCSNHFGPDDNSPGTKKLKRFSIPTLNLQTTVIGNENIESDVRDSPDSSLHEINISDIQLLNDTLTLEVKNNDNLLCGINESKKKWSSVRDQFHRTLQKKKTASGQAAVINRKYKYGDILEFPLPHILDRDTLSGVEDFEENNEIPAKFSEQTCELQNDRDRNEKSITEIQNNFIDSINGDTLSSTTETLVKASVKKNTFKPPLKQKLRHEEKYIHSPESQLMPFILAEKEEENKKSTREVKYTFKHPVDAFLSGIAPTLKSLNPILLNQAKSAIFSIAQEFEMKQFMYSNKQNVGIPNNPNIPSHIPKPYSTASSSQFDSTTSTPYSSPHSIGDVLIIDTEI